MNEIMCEHMLYMAGARCVGLVDACICVLGAYMLMHLMHVSDCICGFAQELIDRTPIRGLNES